MFRLTPFASAAALMLLSACSGPRDEQASLAAAEAFLAKRDTASAAIEIKNALQLRPDSARARFLMARTLFEQEDPAGAEIELTKAIDQAYDPNQVALLRAKLWNAQGRYSATVQEFGVNPLNDAQSSAAMEVLLATAQVGLRQWDAAGEHVRRALSRVPGHEPARVLAVRIDAAQGRLDASLAQAQQLTAQLPGNAEAWKLLGDLLRAQDGKTAEAAAAYEKALNLDATNADALSALIEVNFDRGDLAGVERQVAQLMKVAPNRPTTMLYESRLAGAHKDYERAHQILEGLLKVSPNDVRFLQAAGAVAFAAGRRSEAVGYLTKALRTAPENVAVRQILAQVLIEDDRAAQALKVLEPLNSTGPADGKTLALAARANQALGDTGRAAQQLSQAAQRPGASPALRIEAEVVAALAKGGGAMDVDKLSRIASQDPTVLPDVKLIEALLQRKQYPQALQAVAALDKKSPKSAVPPTLKGRVQWLSGQRDAARQSFAEALGRDANHFPALANLAAMDVEDRKLGDARRRLDGLLLADPGHVEALLTLADLDRMAGQPAALIRERIAAAVKANPGSIEARLALVDHDVRQGDANAALEAAQAANSALPNSIPILERIGRLHLMRGQNEPARSAFGAVLSLDAKNLPARLGMADALLGIGNTAGATEAVERAIADAPRSAEALRAGANLALRANQYGKVVQYARRVQELRPQESAGFLMEGQAELLRGGYPAAARAFSAVLTLADNPDAAAGLHRALLGAKRNADAQAFAESWAAKHPEDVGFQLKAAEGAIANRDFAGAERVYRQLIEKQPRHAVALNNLAIMLLEQRKPGAVAFAQRAVELSPQQTDFADTLAQTYAGDKDFAKAIDLQRKVVERAPQVPDYRLNLAKLQLASRDEAGARKELQELKKLGPAYPRQAEVTKLLQGL